MANLVGTAGEHFTAGELSRLGFLVTLTRGNAPGIDILAYHPATQRTVALQVKTAHSSNQPFGTWLMNAKDSDEAI
jgi:HD-like signal output (HDOD) protein